MTGPVNIIILDRVLPNGLTGNDAGDLLPQVIVDNNFKFPMMTAGGGSTAQTGRADGSYTAGGSVWR